MYAEILLSYFSQAKKNVDLPIGRRSSTLPAGWHKMTDDTSGRLYYYNENTKESVWKPPRTSVFIENIPPQKVSLHLCSFSIMLLGEV